MPTMKNFRFLSLDMCAVLWASCGDKTPITPTYPEVKNLDEMKVPDNFNYELSREVSVRVVLQSVDGSPLKAVKVQINGLLEDGSLSPILDVMTNQNGVAETSFSLPMSDDTVIVSPNFIGLANHIIVPVKNNAIQITVGGSNETSFTTLRQAAASAPSGLRTSGVATTLRYKYLSTYNSLGVRTNIAFATPQTPSALGVAPFNPFMISNLRRGYEVLLPGSMPTDKADVSIFGTYHDNTSSATNKYYKTKNNLPFALHIPASFDYPIEKQSVHNGHSKFTTWAQSGGALYSDWYQNKPSYRNSSNLFIK